MKNLHLKFHHLGLAVKQPEKARLFVSTLGYEIGEAIFDPEQNVHLMMCTHTAEPSIEIIWPGTSKGPIDKLMREHSSGIVYHTCYVTDNLSLTMETLNDCGLNVVCISPPKAALLFNGKRVSFYNVVGMGLIEILE